MAELKKPKPSEMCPPGYHVVKGHNRVCHSGTVTWVDAHICRNRGKIRPGLLKENIYHLFWKSKKKFPALNQIIGFKKGTENDSLIQFWLSYWQSQGVQFPKDLTPLMIKALIAVESSFNPKAKTNAKNSTASGLMQITNQTLRILGGFPNKKKWIEVRKNLIHVTKEDKLDPVINVALGIRWLGHKHSQAPPRYPKNAKGTLTGYHSFDKVGEVYAEKILLLTKKAKKKK
jgi:hypothetical protein